jgi:hypothetical protein
MFVERWHNWVDQPKRSRQWHQDDVADELAELNGANGLIHRWSELSDVVYTVTRARWSGHDPAYPIKRHQIAAGYLYMYPKYSLRVLFFRRAGQKAGVSKLNSVRNPAKEHKLVTIAKENGIKPDKFVAICQQQLKRWRLLP